MFAKGCTGRNLDILARQYLWREGLDYKHGTGHGVGYILNCHEGPQRISYATIPGSRDAVLKEGMMTSNEPGFYPEGKFGVRIENILLTVPHKDAVDGTEEFLTFEDLTLVPYDRDAIEKDLLSPEEREWIDTYHALVYDKLSSLVDSNVRDWLKSACAPL